MTTVIAAILQNEAGEFLICQRDAGGSCGFLWEFPGGKLEAGETSEECVVRECREELGVDIAVGALFCETTYQYPERTVHLYFFRAKIVSGVPKASVHREIRWAAGESLKEFPFCPADDGVIAALAERA